MDTIKAVVEWAPSSVIATFILILLWLIKSGVKKTYEEIVNMLKQIQKKIDIFDSQLAETRNQFKDGIHEIKLQLKDFVPFRHYLDFQQEVKEELSLIREKIAKYEHRQ